MNLFSLNQQIQKSKVYNRPNDFKSTEKLTKAQQEAIDVSGGGTNIIEISGPEELAILSQDGELQPGAFYKLPLADPNLYGGTVIYVKALTTNHSSSNGYGEFYNPKYEDFNIFNGDANYVEDDIVIWGGKVWRNNSDNSGFSNGWASLSEDWTAIAYSDSNYYTKVIDEIEYDLTNDYIVSRYEVQGNNYVCLDKMSANWFWCGANPIQVFRWGHPFNTSTEKGIRSCTVKNSYFNCLNIQSCSISSVELSGYSSIVDLDMIGNNSYVEKITLDNNSSIQGITLNNSSIYLLKIDSESGLYAQVLTDSTFYNCSISLSSSVVYNILNNSTFRGLDLSYNSGMAWYTLDNSTVQALTLKENSFTQGVTLNNSSLENFSLSCSNISGIELTNTWCFSWELRNSSFYDLTNIGNQYNSITLNSISQSYNGFTGTGGEKGTVGKAGELKYKFSVSLDGATGSGEVGTLNIPMRITNYNWYIHEVIVDSSTLSYSEDSIINLGMTTQPASGLNDTSGLISSLNDKVSIFSFANGSLPGAKATDRGVLIAEIKNSPVLNGILYFEVTLKNIIDIYIND